MTKPSLLRDGWTRVKAFAPAVMAASLMYGGINQFVGEIKDLLGIEIMRLVNTILEKISSTAVLLPRYGRIPWLFYATVSAIGVILGVTGMLLGLWVHTRSQHRPAP